MPSSAASRASAQQVLRVAAELARQVAHGTRTAERHAQQQLCPARIAHELPHLVGIVGDERPHAEAQRIADILITLDRMRVDAAARIDAQALYELHFSGGGEIEKAALCHHRLHHGRVRQRLQGVVQIDAGQSLTQFAELDPDALGIEDEQWRAEFLHQPADLRGLERIDETGAAHRCGHGRHC